MKRTAEEWGRIAVSLPGWTWMPGMLDTEGDRYVYLGVDGGKDCWPDPDDPATAGCLLALLGDQWSAYHYRPAEHPARTPYEVVMDGIGECVTDASSLGRSCIIAAVALGRWPGGEG